MISMQQCSDIVIHTQVYNGEKTIRRTIESVLKQTYKEFLYYISDNNSTDGTATIIAEYAETDKRIVPIYNKTNKFYAYHDIVRECCKEYPDGYWAMLDADDEYEPEFLESMLTFIKDNDLDIAICGFTGIVEESGRLIGQREVSEDLILTGAGFCEHFCAYHALMRTVWGKLYTNKVLDMCDFTNAGKMPNYGGDTVFVFEALKHTNRVGIMARSLHRYYVSSTSVSRKWEPERIMSERLLDDYKREFLLGKCGEINKKNDMYLSGIYFSSVAVLMPVLFNKELNMSYSDRIANLNKIIMLKETQELFNVYARENELDDLIRNPVVKWLFDQPEFGKKEGVHEALGIVHTMYPQLRNVAEENELIHLIIESPETVKQILEEYGKLGL